MISSTVLFIYFKTSINWLQWSQNSITFSSEQRRGCIHGQTFVCFGKIAYEIKEITNKILEHMYTSCMFRVVRNDAFVRRISIIRITRIEVHCKLKGVQMDTKTLIVSSIMFKPGSFSLLCDWYFFLLYASRRFLFFSSLYSSVIVI